MAKRTKITPESKLLDKTQFTTHLEAFKRATDETISLARTLAEAAFLHAEKHGDVSYCQEFFDAMPANFHRKAAFVRWLGDHSPIVIRKEKFGILKDKEGKRARDFDVEGALTMPFWEYAPDQEKYEYTAADVFSALKNVLNRFKNSKRYKGAADSSALEFLSKTEETIMALEPQPSVNSH